MAPGSANDPIRQRRLQFPSIRRHTVTHDAAGLGRLLIYSPHWPDSLGESMLKVWRELRASPVPQREALYVLLTLHPWCWERWGFWAKKTIQGYQPHGDAYEDVIQGAQADLLSQLLEKDQIWQSAIEKPIEGFLGWVMDLMRNLCKTVWHRLDRQSEGTKKLHRKQLGDGQLELTADKTDVAAKAAAKEIWAKLDAYPALISESLKLRAFDYTITQIALAWGVSKDQVYRAISKNRDRLRKDFKSFLD
jgi:DNA-directed RNA polymerase specialized sigma24 family protein